MNETLILWLGETPDAPVKWALMADGAARLSGEADDVAALARIDAAARAARQVVAVLRGEEAAMRAMPAPPRSNAQFRAAASLLLEDELAEPAANVHVAVHRHPQGAGQALAAKRESIERWRDALAGAGLAPGVMTAEFSLLGGGAAKAIIVLTHARAFGAVGLQGFAMERPLADEFLPSLLADEGLDEIVIHTSDKLRFAADDETGADWRGPLSDEQAFCLFAESLSAGGAPNFLQGEYRKKRDWKGAAAPWRRAAILAAACLGALVFTSVADSVRSLRIAEQLQADALALHRAAYPDAGGVAPAAYARTVLASGGGAPVFLPISTHIAESLGDVEGVQLDRVRFNAERGEYTINLRVGDVESLDAFKRSLEARGVIATETGGVRRSGGFYIGEMKVSLS